MTVDIRDRDQTAALIKLIDKEFDDWRTETMQLLVWSVHELANDDDIELPELSDKERKKVLSKMPTDLSKKSEHEVEPDR